MTYLQLSVLGGFEARSASGRPVRLTSKKARALLAYVALTPGKSHTRDDLAGLLWSDASRTSARNSLRQELSVLRRALAAAGAPVIDETRSEITTPRDAVEVDAALFERLVAQNAPAALARAVDLYKGDFLRGLEPASPMFEDWLGAERERLRDRALRALDRLLEHQLRDAPADAPAIAHRLLALDPVRESAHRALMQCQADDDRLGDAIRQYQACVAVLRRELGVEPTPATRRLYQTIVARQRADRRTPGPQRRPEGPPPPATPRLPDVATPLAGRLPELGRLETALERVLEGHGRIVEIVGEAGIGKSRLVGELAVRAAARGARVLVGHCRDTEQVLPLRPWVELLEGFVHAPEVRSLSPAAQMELAGLLPETAEPGREPARRAGDPVRLFEAVLALLRQAAATAPLVLLLEDLHWADDTTVRLLSFLVRRLDAMPVLLAATVRTEEMVDAPLLGRLRASLVRDDALVRVELGALSREDTLRLVSALRSRASEERLGDRVWSFSKGHPLLAVEAVRAVEEGGRLGASQAPARARELFAGRLARLGERARQLTIVAAVIGVPFDFRLLHRAGGLSESETSAAVEELSRRGVLMASGDRLAFAHERIRDVAYSQILPPVRKALHATVAAAIETLAGGALDGQWATLAHHHRESGAWEPATRCFHQAGREAASRAAHREAVACFEQALAALGHLAETPERLRDGIDVRFDLRNSLFPLGAGDAVDVCLRDAEAIAVRLGDRSRLAWLAAHRTWSLVTRGDYRAAIDEGRRALAAVGDVPDARRLTIQTNFALSRAFYSLGGYADAITAGREAVAALADRPDQRTGGVALPAVVCRSCIAGCLAELGRFREARDLAAEALSIAQAADHRNTTAVVARWMGEILSAQGDPGGLAFDQRAMDLAREGEFDLVVPMITAGLGVSLARNGATGEGLRLVEEAHAAARDNPFWMEQREHCLAEAYFLAGRTAEAARQGLRVLAIARDRGARGVEAWTLRLLGLVAGARGDEPSAERWLREALELATKLEMRPLQAHCHLGLGRILRRRSRSREARAALGTAAALFGTLEMAAGRAEAEAALGEA